MWLLMVLACGSGAKLPGPERVRAEVCAPHSSPHPESCHNPGEGSACTTDAQCVDDALCFQARWYESDTDGGVGCLCKRDACTRDSDCPASHVCACLDNPLYEDCGTGPVNVCLPGNCRTSADCGAGRACVGTRGEVLREGISGYYCTTARDRCRGDEDCEGREICAYDTEGRWICVDGVGGSCE